MEKNRRLIRFALFFVIIFMFLTIAFFTIKPIEGPLSCELRSPLKNYVAKSVVECSQIKFTCEPGMQYFQDSCGCGCEPTGKDKKNYCPQPSKNQTRCITQYQPVCGWFDVERAQCTRYPCAQTYSNSCVACSDELVSYWTAGECST